jgi:hypothetical protein
MPPPHTYRGAKPYFDHFSSDGVDRAHAGTQGNYSFDLGSWHIVGLDANCVLAPAAVDGRRYRRGGGLPHLVEHPVRRSRRRCYEGHIHNYQRLAPMNPVGNSHLANGITEYTV